MAVGDDEHDDNLERDAGLVRLLGIAGEEAPPPALDAAILAAARRAAHAQPQGSRSSGASQPPRVSATRRWYAPVSIAAVLVVSVSLVTVVYREQGDELIQPSPGVPAPTAARVPDSASAGVQGPKLESPGTLPHAERGDAEKRETAPAQPQFAEDNNAGRAAKLGAASSEPDSPKERPAATDKAAILAQSAATAPLAPRPRTAARDGGAAAVPPPERARDERARFTESNIARSAPAPAVAAADALQSPGAPSAQPAAYRPPWLVELENQPADKWLKRLAAFRRDGRLSDADALLAEFRRRFPDHPFSAR